MTAQHAHHSPIPVYLHGLEGDPKGTKGSFITRVFSLSSVRRLLVIMSEGEVRMYSKEFPAAIARAEVRLSVLQREATNLFVFLQTRHFC